MKKLYLVWILLFSVFNINAQHDVQNVLSIKNKGLYQFDKIFIEAPQIGFIKSDIEPKTGPYRFAYNQKSDISFSNSGEWNDLKDGNRICLLEIENPGALGLIIYYDAFEIPESAHLYIYNADHSVVLGPFTASSNPKCEEFATGILTGDKIYFEYYQPEYTTEKPVVEMGEIAYVYRGLEDNRFAWNDPAGSCEVNVNCPEGNDWQMEKRGIARIISKEGAYSAWCSGSLLNNERQDGTPFFLTACHCGETSTESEFNQWLFHFNYETENCETSETEPVYNLVTGAQLKARRSLDGGSDFMLLELNELIPMEWNLYYNGWDAVADNFTGGVSIHHPSGSVKKISTFSGNLSSATPNIDGSVMATNSTWKVSWVETVTNHGVTEGGSSGSPLFNEQHRVIGTLSGGGASCSNLTSADYYGKFSYHWLENGVQSDIRIQNWLDPDSKGITGVDGFELQVPLFPGPTNLNFTISDNDVSLTWSNPSIGNSALGNFKEGESLYGYLVYRNGMEVSDTLNPNISNFSDENLELARYSYYVKAVYKPTGTSKASNTVYPNLNTGVLNNKKENQLLILPNPNMGEFKVLYQSDYRGDVLLKVYNLSGQIIHIKEFKKLNKIIDEQIILPERIHGTCVIQIIEKEKVSSEKVFIN